MAGQADYTSLPQTPHSHSESSPPSPPCDPPPLQAPENPPCRDPSHFDSPADRLCQGSSPRYSAESPLQTISSLQAEHSSGQQQEQHSSKQLQLDVSFSPQEKYAERLWGFSSSAPSEPNELSCQKIPSSDQLMNDASTEERAHHSLREASPLHPSNGILASEALPEPVWQEPDVQVDNYESSSYDEDSPAEEPLLSCAEEEFHCPTQEQELPDDVKREKLVELCKGVSILSCKSGTPGGCCYVYLIGTAHVSEESCKEVRAATSLMKPEVVFLELCEKRSYVLRRTQFVVPTASDMLAMWKEKKTNMLGIVYSWFMAKVAAKLDVYPGSEFRAAYEEAIACGARVVLGDRDIEVTLRRTWGKMSMWYKMKFVSSIVYNAVFLPKSDQLNELIEKLKDADILTLAFEELGKSFPTVMETVIDERDMFMTAVLQKIAEQHSSIVAVVGRGHVSGITKFWGQDIPIDTLVEIPQKKSKRNTTTKFYVLAGLVALTSILIFFYYGTSSR